MMLGDKKNGVKKSRVAAWSFGLQFREGGEGSINLETARGGRGGGYLRN